MITKTKLSSTTHDTTIHIPNPTTASSWLYIRWACGGFFNVDYGLDEVMRINFWVDSIQEDDSFEVDSDCVPRVGEFVHYRDHRYTVKSIRYKVRNEELWASVAVDKIYE